MDGLSWSWRNDAILLELGGVVNVYPVFGSKQGNFVPLYHTQVMTDSKANNFETM